MRRTLPASALAFVLATLAAAPAGAVRTPDALAGRPALERFGLEVLSGEGAPDVDVRGRMVWDRAPRALRGAFATFQTDVGGGWRAAFDGRTGVPRRLYGPGIPAPGSVASADAAEKAARLILERHVALLAPGASATDFELVANELDAGMRTVGFAQTASGMRVLGGQVSFRFKNDRLTMIGSEALPRVRVTAPDALVAAAVAKEKALAWVASDFGAAEAGDPGDPLLLPVSGRGRSIDYVVVLPVVVRPLGVTARFAVLVDAATGEPVAREQTLRFASATVFGHVPERSPSYGDRADYVLPLADLNVEGAAAQTTDQGIVTWTGASPTPVELFLRGDRARVFNDAGPEATLLVDLSDTQAFSWDASADAPVDAQITTFVHASLVREYARTFAPTLGFLNQQVQATVNIDDVCNAFSDGTTINFFRSGGGCENTGRIADVVYHEFGHSLHAHAIIEGAGAFDGALSEGISDYLAATITGDPAMGRGFFFGSDELRHIDPPGQENMWPQDLVGEVHYDGLIIGQALWDLRKELITTLGEPEGIARANYLFYQGIRRASDIPTMHVEVLAADDDDGDLTNGTPNVCEINRAFGRHGLFLASATGTTPGVVPPTQSGFEIRVELAGLFEQCSTDQINDAILTWKNRDVPSASGTVVLTQEGNLLRGTIPDQSAGTVVQYGVAVGFVDGGNLNLPDNDADPWYEFFVGDVIPLYCTDFETDPEAQGWTHGLISGEMTEGADDWHWGEPNGTASNGDPLEAFSGDNVIGNDLRPEENYNGLYQADRVNYMKSPAVATQGHTNVRLQYRRWLNVEDGHFDQGTVFSNDMPVWENLDSDDGDESDTHHQDREWRFSDVDLSGTISPDGTVQITFQIASDQGLELGGWTIDDFCIVAYEEGGVDPCLGGGCGGAGGAGGDSPTGGFDDDADLEPNGGCACAAASRGGDLSGFAALAALAAATLRRRRRGSARRLFCPLKDTAP
jgi:MYXO-CTERM domain-containing protein